jgi:hypothetical protein
MFSVRFHLTELKLKEYVRGFTEHPLLPLRPTSVHASVGVGTEDTTNNPIVQIRDYIWGSA